MWHKLTYPTVDRGQRLSTIHIGWALLLLLLAAALVAGCSSDDGVTDSPQTGSCIDCHTSKDQILATAEVDTSGGPGEAGEG